MPKADATSQLTDLEIETVGLVGKAANRQKYVLFKSQDGGNMPEDTKTQLDIEATEKALEEAKDVDEVKGVVGKMLEGIKSLFVQTADDVEKDDEPEEDTRLADLEKAQKETKADLTKALERVEAAEELAKTERDLRVQQEYVQKAQDLAIPGTVTELAEMLKWANETDAEKGAALEAVLKAASEAVVSSGMYIEKGTQETSDGNTPFLELVKARAQELAKSGEMTSEEAHAKAYTDIGKSNPEEARNHIRGRQKETGRK